MRDDKHVAVRVQAQDVVHRRRDTTVESGLALATGDDVPVRLIDPAGPGLGIALGDLFCGQPFPFPEENLTQGGPRLGLQVDGGANDLGGLEGARQVAGIQAGEAARGETSAEQRSLAPSQLGQWRVELTLDAVLLVPRRLAVADEDKARGSGTGGKRELWWLWARGSDTDAYTNFLLNPDRARPISGEDRCNRTAR